MSTAHLRLIAIAVTAIAAAITGVAAGLVAPGDDGSFGVNAAMAGFGGAAVTGVLLVILLVAATKKAAAPAQSLEVPADAETQATIANLSAHVEQLNAERAALVNTCVYVRDRATSQAIADRIGAALHEIGVVTLAPTGIPFDPAHHEAGGAAPSPDPSKVGTIAAVEVPGYVDRGSLLRAPVVTVFRQKEA
ncbi:nucleotide exchange factor GrpE [Phytomonospora sp. NPDC050363]|uniref:nucleotide exchange factor GrpE n=1 Tax=Phytomonospora sp. NPDC050363 TaxID=3155642 RepID=UPI0033D2CAC2